MPCSSCGKPWLPNDCSCDLDDLERDDIEYSFRLHQHQTQRSGIYTNCKQCNIWHPPNSDHLCNSQPKVKNTMTKKTSADTNAEQNSLEWILPPTYPIKLNIGSGKDKEHGWIGVDIVGDAHETLLIAPAWAIPLDDNSVNEIKSEHLIEHLTYYQFQRAMEEWRRLLKPGGRITIECPDLEAVCQGFVKANNYERYNTQAGSWCWLYQIYGHQRGNSEEEQLSQTHKSGYTYEYLYQTLKGLRYINIEKRKPQKAAKENPCIRITATKTR